MPNEDVRSRTPQIVCVVGARPNFMKMAPILEALPPKSALLVHTGQHYDSLMSDVFLHELGLPTPDVFLSVGSGTQAVQTARILEAFESAILELTQRPKGIVVVGDVNSTMACALVASKLHIPIAHVEAGLRSFDRGMPEEINRLVTDSISDLLFVSEPSGELNLIREGVSRDRIRVVGNVMIDTLMRHLPHCESCSVWHHWNLMPGQYGLVTLHRPSNVDDGDKLKAIVTFLCEISSTLDLVFPLHPRTRGALENSGLLECLQSSSRIHVADPLSYCDNLGLLSGARLVLTDSGGIQEESSFLGVPCLTLRENTERPITIELGTNRLVGDNFSLAKDLFRSILTQPPPLRPLIPNWDGRAAERIAASLKEEWAL